jgi:hypothetical protein
MICCTSSKGSREKREKEGREEGEDISLEENCKRRRVVISMLDLLSANLQAVLDEARREWDPEMKEVGAGRINTRTHFEALRALARCSGLLETAPIVGARAKVRQEEVRSVRNSFPLPTHFHSLQFRHRRQKWLVKRSM